MSLTPSGHVLQCSFPFRDCSTEGSSEFYQCCDAFIELLDFQFGKFKHLSAWGASTVTLPKDSRELLQRETRSHSASNEHDPVERLRRIETIVSLRPHRPLQDAEPFVVPQRV